MIGPRHLYGHPDGLDEPALAVLLAAFWVQGIEFNTEQPNELWARFQLVGLATWARVPPTELRLEDPRSAELNERLAEAAATLIQAIDRVEEQVQKHSETKETDRVETCQFVFPTGAIAEEYRASLSQLEFAARDAGRWARPGGKGRPKLWLFYEFVKRLHLAYEGATGLKGFVERDGTSTGPFVELVHACQAILPIAYRQSDPRTTGERVLRTFSGENQENGSSFT